MFTLPTTLLRLAPWEYVVFLLDVTAEPSAWLPAKEGALMEPSIRLVTYQPEESSIPSIITYNYSSVLSMENEIQQVGVRRRCEVAGSGRSLPLSERNTLVRQEQHCGLEDLFWRRTGRRG